MIPLGLTGCPISVINDGLFARIEKSLSVPSECYCGLGEQGRELRKVLNGLLEAFGAVNRLLDTRDITQL